MTTLAMSADSPMDVLYMPYSQQAIAEQCVGVAPEIKHNMFWANASRLYSIGREGSVA